MRAERRSWSGVGCRDGQPKGKSEATIAVGLAVVGRICKFAARRLGWSGTIPTTLMLQSERPKVSQTKRRPIFTGEQVEQTIAAAHEPFRALFTVAALTGARISKLCGLTWADVRIDNLDDAEIEFGWPARSSRTKFQIVCRDGIESTCIEPGS